MTHWETPQLNQLNASNDAQGKTVNVTRRESGVLHTFNSVYKHYAKVGPVS